MLTPFSLISSYTKTYFKYLYRSVKYSIDPVKYYDRDIELEIFHYYPIVEAEEEILKKYKQEIKNNEFWGVEKYSNYFTKFLSYFGLMRKPEQILLDSSEELLELSIRHGKLSVTFSILNELKKFAPNKLKQIATNALFAAIDSNDSITTELLLENYGADINGRSSSYEFLTPLELAVSTAAVFASNHSLEEVSYPRRNIVQCNIPMVQGSVFYDKDRSITDRYDVNEDIIFILVKKGAQVTDRAKLYSMQAVTLDSSALPQRSSSNILDAAIQKHGNPFWNLLEKKNTHEGSIGRHIASFIGEGAETKRTSFIPTKAAEYWERHVSERSYNGNILYQLVSIGAPKVSHTRRFDTDKTPLWGNAR